MVKSVIKPENNIIQFIPSQIPPPPAPAVCERNRLYAKRTAVERSIASFKAVLGLDGRKTSNTATTKTDLFLAGITQLLGVLLAAELHDMSLARRIRKLAA